MSINELFFDIYLWVFPENDKVIKIGHLTRNEAEELSKRWFELNELHDYMLVTEASTPFMDEPSTEVKTKEWLMGVESIDQL